MKQTDARLLSSDSQYDLRIRIIKYLEKGHTIMEAVQDFEVSKSYIQKIKKLYAQGGISGLKLGKRGRRQEGKINKTQRSEISKLIRDKMPEQLKLLFGLWTRKNVAALIKDRYGITVSRWTVGRYLKNMGFSPQKPAKRAYEQNPVLVRRWLQEEYPEIKKRAKQEQAKIFWGDETGVRSDDQIGRTYAPVGKTPVVKKSGNRFSINLISAISNRGDLKFMIIKERLNSKVFIEFMSRMLKGERQKIYLIVDSYPAHKSKEVQKWLTNNTKKLELFYLPPYSPELNPDEYLNQDLKTNTVRSKPPKNKDQMTDDVKNFIGKKKKNKATVKAYFRNKYIMYAA